MTRLWCAAGALLLLVGAAPAGAQMSRHPPMGPPAFLRELFVPELIMRYQEDIALGAGQRDAITREMTDAQKKLVDFQWQFEAASKQLAEILRAPRIDEAIAMAQADKVLRLELQMKRAHLELLVRVKNILTPEQQEKLRGFAAKEPPRFGSSQR